MTHHLSRDDDEIINSVDIDDLQARMSVVESKTTISAAQAAKLAHISITQACDLDQIEADTNTNNSKVSMVIGTAADQAMAGNTTTISASQANQINTNQVNIASNAGSIAAHAAALSTQISDNDDDITAIGNMLAGTASSGLKTLIDANTAKVSFPGFGTSGSTALVGNTPLLQLGTSGTTALAGDTTTITGAQAADIAANKAELANITITTTNISNTRILLGSGTGFANGVALQNANLNSGTLANTHLALKQDQTGNLFLNCATGKTISFRRNNVELFADADVKTLTDNISVSQAVDLDSMESSISLNNSLIYTNLNLINNSCLPPLKIHCLAHRVSHIGSTAMAGASDLVNMTNAFQAIRWENVVGSTHGGGITWSTINSSTNTYFQIPETALYRVSATIICMFTSSGNERQCSLELAHYNNSSGAITSIRQTHSSMNRQDGNNFSFSNISMDTPTLLEEDEYYFFRCKSENQGNIAIHSSAASANSVIITKIQTDAAGNTFGTGGATSYNFDGHRTFVGV